MSELMQRCLEIFASVAKTVEVYDDGSFAVEGALGARLEVEERGHWIRLRVQVAQLREKNPRVLLELLRRNLRLSGFRFAVDETGALSIRDELANDFSREELVEAVEAAALLAEEARAIVSTGATS